jgi:deferrochelatase/peroxidase EfeB
VSAPASPDWAQVQRLVVQGSTLHRSWHFLLRARHPGEARRFIEALVHEKLISYASAREDAPVGGCELGIGFTYRGLQHLGLPWEYLRLFQEKAAAFAEGACRRAAQHLADTGASAAHWWEPCFHPDHAHLVLTMHADQADELRQCTQTLKSLPGASGLTDWAAPLEASHLTDQRQYRTVHFGLRDLIASPAIKGFHPRRKTMHEPGEFVLGYRNDHEFNPWALHPSPSGNLWLPPLSAVKPNFFWNGSFGVLRKMEQHEREFRCYVARWAKKLGVKEEYLRAKMNGRWDNGQRVRPGESEPPPNPAPGELDDFDFLDDPEGKGCPFGSHIRRMNPRSDNSVVPVRRRPLIRRGMPYGPLYDEAKERGKPAPPRGLLGVFFCASLEDQFEHLLAEWGDANPLGPDNRGNAKDPFIGSHIDPKSVFDIPLDGEKLCQLEGFEPFVTTRGTLYAFFPGMAGLRMLGESH